MTNVIKKRLRILQYRFRPFRYLTGLAAAIVGRSRPLGVAHLLTFREKDSIGPLQREEALLLFSVTRVIRPTTIVEFGFFHGHSAFNFLQAVEPDARIFSFDIAEVAAERAANELNFDPRLHFRHKSQADFSPEDIEGRSIDLAFFDGAHDLEINCETFRRVHAHLSDEALIVIHDTGLWHRSQLLPLHHRFMSEFSGQWVTEDLFAHQPDERKFADWIRDHYPEMQAIHFHTTRTLRHGMTILQKSRRLSFSK